jgi:cell division protein FtsX
MLSIFKIIPFQLSTRPMIWSTSIITFLLIIVVGISSYLPTPFQFQKKIHYMTFEVAKESAPIITQSLQNMDQTRRVIMMDDDKIQSLITPWIGEVNDLDILALPAFIEVESSIPGELILNQLKQTNPNTPVILGNDQSTSSPQMTYISSGLIIFLISILWLVFQSNFKWLMTSQRDYISLLRLLGAKPSSMAKSFQWYIFKASFQGVFLGLLLCMLILIPLFLFKSELLIPLKTYLIPFASLPITLSMLVSLWGYGASKRFISRLEYSR